MKGDSLRSAGGEARARAFVCTGPTCSAPVTDPAALADLLRAIPGTAP